MKPRRRFKEGDYVRVRGFNNRAYIWSMMDRRQGSVMLDRPIDGFAMWNVTDLILFKPKPKRRK